MHGGTGGNGGQGGNGGFGGVGGPGPGPTLKDNIHNPYPERDDDKLWSGPPPNIQRTPIDEFCQEYALDETIEKLLHDNGLETANSLFEVDGNALRDVGFELGHIPELKRALREFVDAVGE
ncbi:hypothetical protein C8R45DRAFT_1100021 [Mycena sanguinolenta]|nr:hypothetical protein C8R45DRAFT_1100021 [Mycena sanguinolenta]